MGHSTTTASPFPLDFTAPPCYSISKTHVPNPNPKCAHKQRSVYFNSFWRICHYMKWYLPNKENGSWRWLQKYAQWHILLGLIGKTPVRIILWCPITKMLMKAWFAIQPLEQEGGCQKCCISLCSKVFINHFYKMKASPGCLNILTYWSKYWEDRLRRTIRHKKKSLNGNILSTDMSTLLLYFTSSCPHRMQRS